MSLQYKSPGIQTSKLTKYLPFTRDRHTFKERIDRHFDEVLRNMRAEREESFGKPIIYHDPLANARRFEANFDLKQFKPEDIAIKLDNGTVVVETKEETVKDKVRNITVLNRKIILPREVDMKKLTSILSADGILTINGPVDSQSPIATAAARLSAGAPSSPQMTRRSTFAGGSPANDNTTAGAWTNAVSSSGSRSPQMARRKTFAGSSSTDDNASAGAWVNVVATTPQSHPKPKLEEPTFFNSAKGRELVLLVDIGKTYLPEDISVKVDGFAISVQAIHESKTGVQAASRSVNRDFIVPELIDPATVTANIKDGILEINALVVK